jgi:beta-1,4-mannosyltransferase
MKYFGVLGWPAYRTKKRNPYNYLIYSNIEKSNFPVYDFKVDLKHIYQFGFSSKYKILHIHWPRIDILAVNRKTTAYRRFITFYLFVRIMKLFRKKLVWTVHNLTAHEIKYSSLQTRLDRILYKYVDGFITLNKVGIEVIRGKVSDFKRQKIAYIPHPHYIGYYRNEVSRDEARSKLGIGCDKFVFLFLGQLRPYKNVTGLIEAFKSLRSSNYILLIAGAAYDEVKAELREHLIGAENIRLYDFFVQEDDLQIFLNAADLAVTPYNKVFNSGSVFLNLSFNKPTLAPDVFTFTELKDTVGNRWVKTYTGSIDSDILLMAAEEVKKESKETIKPGLENFDPEKIAMETIRFYHSLLA